MQEAQFEEGAKTLLLVDDDLVFAVILNKFLGNAGYRFFSVTSVDEAEVWLTSHSAPDLVFVDIEMPERNGFELIAKLKYLEDVPFIFVTSHMESDFILKATQMGATGYLVKPIDFIQLLPTILTAIAKSEEMIKLKRTAKELQSTLDKDRSISVATGILMDQYRVDHDKAMTILRNTARSKRMKLIDLAHKVIHASEALDISSNQKLT
jgi:response regulator NasT